MKATMIAALAVVGVAAPQALASTDVVWQGEAEITAATAQCFAGTSERTKIAKGTILKSVVRPAGLGTNGADSRLSFTHDNQSVFAVDLAGGLTIAGTGSFAAFGITSSGLIQTNVGGNYNGFALTPASPTVSTPSLTLTGTVQDFMFVSGCTITFRAGYVLRTF